MESGKNHPNPKPAPAPAAAGDEGIERKDVEAAPEEAEEEPPQFVEREGDGGEEQEEEFEYVSEFVPRQRNPRTPFTSLSQIDADLALARTLQEQERAFQMLSMGGGGGGGEGEFGDSEDGSDFELDDEGGGDEDDILEDDSVADENDYDEDAFDAQDPAAGVDPAAFDNDETYARALQDAEERDLAARFTAFAGIHDWVADDARDQDNNTQDAWSDSESDVLSYEELVALGEVVGTESRGLTTDAIASLPSISYNAQNAQGSNDQCVICCLDYEDGDSLVVLSCRHTYHPECINKWLQISKVCPCCSAEVSSSENR